MKGWEIVMSEFEQQRFEKFLCEEVKKEKNKAMSELEKQGFEEFVKGMSKEEQEIAVKHIDMDILWDGIRKRETESRNIVKDMKDLVMGK